MRWRNFGCPGECGTAADARAQRRRICRGLPGSGCIYFRRWTPASGRTRAARSSPTRRWDARGSSWPKPNLCRCSASHWSRPYAGRDQFARLCAWCRARKKPLLRSRRNCEIRRIAARQLEYVPRVPFGHAGAGHRTVRRHWSGECAPFMPPTNSVCLECHGPIHHRPPKRRARTIGRAIYAKRSGFADGVNVLLHPGIRPHSC